MKRFLLISSLLLLVMIVKAQDPLFLEGDKRVNLGVGISTYPVASISVDYGVLDGIFDAGAIGIGPYVGLGLDKYYVYMSLGARGTFHYPLIENLDSYIGLGVGLRYDVISGAHNSLNPIPGFFLGANYPISKKMFVFAEVGSGVSYLTAGISFILE